MTILEEIFAHKRVELELFKQVKPMAQAQAEAAQAPPPLDFTAALLEARGAFPALIAEVKRASPSRGVLVSDFDPVRLARIYRENGAAAISVLTDERYFQGSLDHLNRIAASFAPLPERPPLLRKDFIFDEYQLYEARAAGADAVLLIVAGLEQGRLRALHALALELGMASLVEVHSLEELNTALNCDPLLVGINNRDLHNFSVSLETTLKLRPFIPAGICVVAESGIHTPQDVACLHQAGVDAILVGEALVTAADIPGQVRRLSGHDSSS